MTKQGRFKQDTARIKLNRAARYLEQEAADYIREAKSLREDSCDGLAHEWGERASKMIGAARDLRFIGKFGMGPK